MIKGMMYGDAKAGIRNALNEGKSRTKAISNAQEKVFNHVDKIEESLLENAKLQGSLMHSSWEDARTADLLGEPQEFSKEDGTIVEYYNPDFLAFDTHDSDTIGVKKTTYSYETTNGQSYDIPDLGLVNQPLNGTPSVSGGLIAGGGSDVVIVSPTEGRKSWESDVDYTDNQVPPDLDGALSRIRNKRDEVLSQVDTMAQEIYNNNSPGDLPPIEGVQEFVTKRVNNNADDGVASYAAAVEGGYQTNAEADYDITYRERDSNGKLGEAQQISGVLLADSGTFSEPVESGATYDTQSLDGNVYFMYNQGGVTQQTKLTGEFTIDKIYGDDGNELDSVEQRSGTFSSRDTSDVVQQIQQTNQTRETIDRRNSLPNNGGGGGGSGFVGGFLDQIPAWVYAIPVVGAILAALAVVAE
jgi:hypothetical protein